MKTNRKPDAQLALRDARDRTRVSCLTKWQQKFLRALKEEPNVKRACSAARVSRQTAYRHREENAEFAALWADALNAAVDELEATAFKLAKEGDSSLLTFLLRCHRPETYRETSRHEIGVAGRIVFLPQKDDGRE
jgi:hypothetical protein